MSFSKSRRNRGIILTSLGLQKLQNAKQKSEVKENYGNKYTFEKLGEITRLTPMTLRKVLTCSEGVDKRTIVQLFRAFNLELDQSDYSHPEPGVEKIERAITRRSQDWGEAIDVTVFYGRTKEFIKLEQWILNERCRVVALLGMGGIGKTALSVKLAKQIQNLFEYVQWFSLRDAPPVKIILAQMIQFLSQDQKTEKELPESVSERISRLIYYLRSSRCLLILDNMESILSSGSRAGQYREGYEEYGELLKRVGEIPHESCLLLTSREKPKDLAHLEGEGLFVRSLQLSGLKDEEGEEVLKIKGLTSFNSELRTVVNRYEGNALALKIVATTIQDVFDGSVNEFLKHSPVIFGDIYDLLEQQFERLTELEKEIIYWLAINREPISLLELQDELVSLIQQVKLLEALESLTRRSLIEKTASLFTLQSVISQYITSRFIEQVCQEIVSQNIEIFKCYALIQATAKDYIRDTQIRLIVQPIINGLLAVFRSKRNLENQLNKILATLRKESPLEESYTAGNILNLLCHLESNLTGCDFSHLTVWQADLRNVKLHNANFAHANLAKCVFAETLGGIHSVAFSPDGKLLATGDTNGEIRLYQAANGKQLLTVKGHIGFVWPITFSPDGHILASGSDDPIVKLWDTKTGECLASLQGHNGGIWSVAFSPDGHLLATSSEDQTVKLWDVSINECLKTLQGHSNRVTSVAFSPHGSVVASGSDDQTVRLWDTRDGLCLATLQSGTENRSVAFSPDGNTLASGCYDQTVKLWDVNSSQCLQTLHGHNDCVNSVTFSPDGQKLASSSDDQTVKLWDTRTNLCITTLKGHSSRVWSVAFSPIGTVLASGSDDQTVRLWDVSTYQCLKTLQGYCNGIWSVSFSPQGTMLASGSGDQTVKLWDVITGQCLKTFLGHSNRVTSVAFNPDGIMLASGSEDQTVKLWDVSTGQCLKTFSGHSNRVTSVAFSPDGTMLASGSEDQTAKLWDVNTGQCLMTLQGHTHWVWAVAFSPDSRVLVSASNDQTLRLWNLSTGRCFQTMYGHTDWIWSLTFSPDGRTVASGSFDQTVKLWDFSTGQCMKTLYGHTNAVYSVAFLDNCTLASSSGDQTVKLWDVSTGSCTGTLLGHSKLVWSLAFSPDGQTLASSSEDEMIKLWNVKSGKCLKTLRSSRPYEGMNISGIIGLTEAEKIALKYLGAIEY